MKRNYNYNNATKGSTNDNPSLSSLTKEHRVTTEPSQKSLISEKKERNNVIRLQKTALVARERKISTRSVIRKPSDNELRAKNLNEIYFLDRKIIRNATRENDKIQTFTKNILKTDEELKEMLKNKKVINKFALKKFNIKEKKSKDRVIRYNLKDLQNKNPYDAIPLELKEYMDYLFIESKRYARPNIKYASITKNNNIIKTINQTSFFIRNKEKKSDVIKRILKLHNNELGFNTLSRKVKWKALLDIATNNMIVIEQLFKYYKEYKWFLEKDVSITKGVLTEFLGLLKLNTYISFADDSFDLLTRDNQTINVKELYQCFVPFFFIGNLEIKIDFLCDLWEKLYTNNIYYSEVIYLIKNSLYYESDVEIAIVEMKKIFNKKEFLNKNLFKTIFFNDKNRKIRYIFDRNLSINNRLIDDTYHYEINNMFDATMRNWKYHLSDSYTHSYVPNSLRHFEETLDVFHNYLYTKRFPKNYFDEEEEEESNNN